MAIVLAMFYRELTKLRAENRRLRNEVGELSINDPAKFYAMAVPMDEPFTWKWRVWIPAGRRFDLNYTSENIPSAGFPNPNGAFENLPPGEHVVVYRIRKDPIDGHWKERVLCNSSSMGEREQDWVAWPRSKSADQEGVNRHSKEFPTDKPLVLARRRVGPVGSEIPDPSPGFMVWLEPLP